MPEERINYVSKGDRPRARFTSSVFNAFADAANANSQRDVNRKEFSGWSGEQPLSTVYVENGSVTDGDVNRIAGLEKPLSLPADGTDFQNRSVWLGRDPIAADKGKFAIYREATLSGELGLAAIAGPAPCSIFVPTGMDGITHADIDTTNATRLTSDSQGSARILWKEAGDNATVNAVVMLQSSATNSLKVGVADGAITADSATGVVDIYENGSATGEELTGVRFDWMHGGEDISDGKDVVVGYFPDEGFWRILGADCEDEAAAALAQDDLGDSTGNVALDFTAADNYKMRLTGNVTITPLTNPVAVGDRYVVIEQDGVGSHTVTWPGAIKGTPPHVGTASAKYVVGFYWDGTHMVVHNP